MSDTLTIGEPVTTGKGTYRVRLEQDQDADSPREYDSKAGVIIARFSGYHVPREGDHVADVLDWIDNGLEFPEIAYRLRWITDAAVVLPIYSTHDGMLYLGDAADNSHTLAGVTYDDSTVTGEERGVDATWDPELALRSEVEEYNSWATGDVYGYIVERLVPACERCGCDERWEDAAEMSSCWGLIGRDYAEQAAREALAEYL